MGYRAVEVDDDLDFDRSSYKLKQIEDIKELVGKYTKTHLAIFLKEPELEVRGGWLWLRVGPYTTPHTEPLVEDRRGRKKKVEPLSKSVAPAQRWMDDPKFLTTKEAAQLTNMTVRWYELQRFRGMGPPYKKSGRLIRYVKTELLEWWLETGAEVGP